MANTAHNGIIPLILGTATLIGAAAGSVTAFVVYWETADYLIRHSRYKTHALGHLVHRRRTL